MFRSGKIYTFKKSLFFYVGSGSGSGILDDPVKHEFFVKNTGDKFMTGVVDAGHKSLDTNIYGKVHTKFKMALTQQSGP